MRKLIVNSGDQFGKLTVLSEVASESGRKFELLCSCGNTTQAFLNNIRKGHTKSCGCLNFDASIKNRTHGKSSSKVYKAWQSMNLRCQVHKDYIKISVCSEWVKSFESFYDHIGDPPEQGRWSIDRINYNGNYEPGNVRWAKDTTQNRNRGGFRNNKSGTTGVSVRAGRYIATWYELDGTQKSKSFSTSKYGDSAERLAFEYRASQIERLVNLGADYADNHGEFANHG